jgi:hypothetical protein
MSKAVLMPENEPSDEQLSALMKEVAQEAKIKAEKSNKELLEKVRQLIKERNSLAHNE